MSIVHIEHRSRWTGIANTMLEDHRLSFKARGLLAYLLTKPEGWETQVAQLTKASDHDGRSAIYSALEELTQYGYAKYQQPREAGRFVEGGWTIRESPQTGFPLTENPDTEKSITENRDLSKDLKKVITEESKTKENEDPPKAPLVGGMHAQVYDDSHELRALEINPTHDKVASEKPSKPLRSKINTAYTPGFLEWWTVYPPQRRLDKPACFVVWQREQLELRAPELVFKIARLKETTWKHAEPHHIKTTLPYLNGGRYEDDLVPLSDIPAQRDTGMSEKMYQTATAISNLAARRRTDEEHHRELRGVPVGVGQVE